MQPKLNVKCNCPFGSNCPDLDLIQQLLITINQPNWNVIWENDKPQKDNPIQNLIAKPESKPTHLLLSRNIQPNTSVYLHNVQGNKGLSFKGLKATRDQFRQQL